MEEVIIRYTTTTELEKKKIVKADETSLNIDLKDIVSIDLLPLIWCKKLQIINLRHNKIESIDLTPLRKCVNLEGIRLNDNELIEIDLSPLSDCPHLREVDIRNNPIRSVDISPLFHCSELQDLKVEEDATLMADLLLRSIGSWPDVLVDKFHKILWKSSEI